MEIKNIKIRIDRKNVLKRLGHRLKTETDERINRLIDEQINEAYSMIEPYCVYKDIGIAHVKDDEIKLKNAFLIKSSNLAKILRKADKATLIAITIGDELERRTGDLLVDAIRDAIGSEAVEELANEVNRQITKRAKLAGYKTLFRFSVGYGGWDLKDQKKILNILKTKRIKLGKGYIMHPRKSVTALIGWERK